MDNCKNLNRINYNAVECVLVEAASAPGPFLRSATKTMVIGKDVMSLPRGFLNTEIEESIIVRATIPPEYNGGCYSFDIPICVPAGSLAAYQNHEFWGQFTNYSTSYLFDIRSSDETIGRVRILEQPDCYSESNVATVVAEPIGDHPFLNWTSNGQVVSTANPFTFVVEEDIELVANFYGTGVDEETEQKVTVSPNPTKDFVNIECENMKGVVVCTLDGRVVKTYSELNTNAFTLDMTGLSKGINILRIKLMNETIINKKIIKE